MAIQSIPRSGGAAGLGGALGQGLGDTLSAGLQGLAQAKMEKMTKEQNRKELSSLLGPEVAQFVQALPPESQKAAFQNIGALMQLKESMGSQQPQAQQQGMAAQEAPFSLESITPEQREQLKAYVGTPEASKAHTPQDLAKLTNFLSQGQQPAQSAPTRVAAQLTPRPASDKTKLLEDVFTSPHEKREKRKLELAEEKIAQKERHFEKQLARDERKEALAETKEIRKDLFAKKKAAQQTIDNLDEMEDLEKEGLPGAGYLKVLESLGLDIPAIKGAPAEQYEKVAATFVQNAKAQFGSRLTDTDLKLFLKQVPSLSNSVEGRHRINATLRRMANLDKAAVDAYEDIVKENGGIPPLDLDLQLDKALDKKRDAIYKQFKKDLAKEIPEGESSSTTAALTGAANFVRKIPGAVKGGLEGGAAGAYIGSKGGPIGALGGAGLGALAGLAGYHPSSVLKSLL